MIETTTQRIFSLGDMFHTWQRDHSDAKAESKRDRTFPFSLQQLEALFKEAVTIKVMTEKMQRQWIESVTSGALEPNLAVDIEFHQAFQLWYTTFSPLRDLVAYLAEGGFTLRHSEKLLNHIKLSEEVLAITEEPVTAVAPIRPSPPGGRFVDVSRYDD